MIVEFGNGYRLSFEHFPGRKRPIIVLSKDGEYKAHAVMADEQRFGEFCKFVTETFGGSDGSRAED